MRKEKNYEFRKILDQVHLKNRCDPEAVPLDGEVVIDDSWEICVLFDADDLTFRAAKDFRDYLFTSMGVSVSICKYRRSMDEKTGKRIVLAVDAGIAENLEDSRETRAHTIVVEYGEVRITGATSLGVAAGVYYLEDLMNLREAPYLEISDGSVVRKPLFSPRMVHSGWGMDQFPDSHLDLIAHAGFDAILVFVKGVDQTTHGTMDFNDVIRRAEKFGLDVYFYSYLDSYKHPDEPDAEEFFENNYGSVFKHAPGAKGLILVGESAQFPSKDPNTTGHASDYGNSWNEGIADSRSAPGWWPCSDYPKWLEAVKKAVYGHAPDADIVFWTYNWGKEPEKPRTDLIASLPEDISLMATFEMYQTVEYENHTTAVPDYTITFPGPGDYFTSEAKAAAKRDLRLYTMSNTGGTTWDCGVIPYVPTPQQWFKRFKALGDSQSEWGLSGLMDSHHYGWYPSPISECAKWSFWSPAIDLDEILRKIAVRDFGSDAADAAIEAWRLWSEAIDSYTPGFDDQAGPLRVGPAYPFIFHPCLHPLGEHQMEFPTTTQSIVGSQWLHPLYNPEQVFGQTACGRRVHEDISILERTVDIWEEGVSEMCKALSLVPERKFEKAAKLAGVGEFFGCALRTMLHMKRWWLLNKRLEIEEDFTAAEKIMDALEEIVASELDNVRRAIPLVEADSRLGWEPSMDYMADKSHLEWKIRQLENLRDTSLRIYRTTLRKNPPRDPRTREESI
ncbi:MAG: hypothetical protein KAG97_02655 [Victivallales bacterium]|nr:hypothetical protein [Victivallales bacterium]